MMLEVTLCQCLGKCISNLILSVHREDLDEFLAHVFAKVMVTYVDVLSPRT